MTATATKRSFLDAARDEPELEGQGRSFLDAARDAERGSALLGEFGIGQTAAGPTGPRPQPKMPGIPGLDAVIGPGGRTVRQTMHQQYLASLERGPTHTERARKIVARRAKRQAEHAKLWGEPSQAEGARTAEDIRLGRSGPITAGELTPEVAAGRKKVAHIPRPTVKGQSIIEAVEDAARFQGVSGKRRYVPDVEKWGTMGPITAAEMNRRKEWAQAFGAKEAAYMAGLYASVERLKAADGKSYDIREGDLRDVEDYLLLHHELQARGTTLAADVVPGIKQMPAWMLEFVATGGVAGVGKGLAKAGAKRLIGGAVKRKLGATFVRGMGWVGAGAMRTVFMPHRGATEYFDQLMGDNRLSDEGTVIVLQAGVNPATAFLNAIANTMIENMSEEAGGALVKGAGSYVRALPGGARLAKIARRLRVRAPKGALGRLAQGVRAGQKRLAWHGFLGEYGEEELAKIMRAATGTGKEHRGMGLFQRMAESIPSGREMVVQGLTLAAPSLLFGGAGRLAKAVDQRGQAPPPAAPAAPVIPGAQQLPGGVTGEVGVGQPRLDIAPGQAKPITTLSPTAQPGPVLREGTFLEAAKAKPTPAAPETKGVPVGTKGVPGETRDVAPATPRVKTVSKPGKTPTPAPKAVAKAAPAKKPAPAKPAAKEPWEMTASDYAQDVQRRYLAKMGRPIAVPVVRGVGDAAAKRHPALVRKATEAGKPVPRAVLEEYKTEDWAKAALAERAPLRIPPFPRHTVPTRRQFIDAAKAGRITQESVDAFAYYYPAAPKWPTVKVALAKMEGEIPAQAQADWQANRLYLTPSGNWRLKATDTEKGRVAPYNKELKRAGVAPDQLGQPKANRIISEESYKEAVKRLGEPKARGGLVPFSGQDVKDAGTVILYHVESGLRKMGEVWEQVKGQMDAKLFRQGWRQTAAARKRFAEVAKGPKGRAVTKTDIMELTKFQALGAPAEIITTPSKLLGYAMKKAQTASRQAHLAATREMALSLTELSKMAESSLPKSEQGKVLPMIAKARTPAEMRRVAMSISLLAEHHDQRTALAEFKQTTKGIRKLVRKGRIRPEYQAKINALLDSIDAKRHAQHTLDRAERLMKMLEVEPDPNVPHNVIARARSLSESERRTPLYKLSPETIRGITAALKQIVHLSNTKNRIYFGRRAKAAQEVIDNSIAEVEKNNPKVKTRAMQEEQRMGGALWLATRAQLSVDTTAYELGDEGGAVYTTLVDNPLAGNDQFLLLQASAQEALAKAFADQGMTAKDLQKWSASAGRAGLVKRATRALLRREGVELVKTALPKAMTAGARLRQIELTHAQRVTLWCHLHDSDTRRELLRRSVEGIHLTGYHTRAIKLHPADIAALEESITPQEEAIGQAMMDWLNGPCRKAINEAFLSNEGHEIARRTDYFPRRRYGDEEAPEPDKILAFWRDSMLNQQGIFKSREGSKKAVVVGDAFEVFYAHANRCAAYVGKHAAVLDALRLLRHPDFRHTVKSRFRYGGSILFDLEKAVKEYRGLEVQSDAKFERWMRGITSKAHVGILGASPHISLYQVVSYMYAGAEMDARDLAKVWNMRLPTKGLIAEISAHSPALAARFRGTGHQILTPSATRYSMSEFYFGREPGWRSKTMVTIRKMDQLAIANIYQAAKSEGRRKGLSGEALNKYAAKRAEVVTNRTQPTWDLITTSALSVEARKSLWARLAALFSSQTAKIANMAYRSWVRFRRSPKGTADFVRFANTLGLIGVGASAVYWIGRFSWRGMLGPPDERNKLTIADHLWGMTERLLGSWVVVGGAAAQTMRLSRMRAKGKSHIFLSPYTNPLSQAFEDTILSIVEFRGAIAEQMRGEDAKSAKSAMRAVDRLIRALTILGGIPIRAAWATARARLKKKGSAIRGSRARRTPRSPR